MAKFKIQKSATVNQGFDSTAVVGGTGGLTSITGNQVLPVVYITGASKGNGSILGSRGRSKFLVQDGSGNKGICSLVNAPSANVNAGQMSIQINKTILGSANLITYTGSATTFAYVTYATGNVSGMTPAAGDRITGSGANGNVTISTINITNGLANANVSFPSQIISNVTVDMNVSVFARRLTNKFVTDFSNNRYVWAFGTPTSTVVQIKGA